MNGRKQDAGELPRLLLLAVCFLGGIFLGQVLSGRVPDDAGTELHSYLTAYLQLSGEEAQKADTALDLAVVYFRYPVLAFFLGFTSLGIVLLPCLTAAYGFFLSFSVCCFTAAFGKEGVLLTMALFGLRCLVTLPCFFLLAIPSWSASAGLAGMSFGKGRRSAPVARDTWVRFGVVMGVLLAGMCADLSLSPWLLRMVWERIAL